MESTKKTQAKPPVAEPPAAKEPSTTTTIKSKEARSSSTASAFSNSKPASSAKRPLVMLNELFPGRKMNTLTIENADKSDELMNAFVSGLDKFAVQVGRAVPRLWRFQIHPHPPMDVILERACIDETVTAKSTESWVFLANTDPTKTATRIKNNDDLGDAILVSNSPFIISDFYCGAFPDVMSESWDLAWLCDYWTNMSPNDDERWSNLFNIIYNGVKEPLYRLPSIPAPITTAPTGPISTTTTAATTENRSIPMEEDQEETLMATGMIAESQQKPIVPPSMSSAPAVPSAKETEENKKKRKREEREREARVRDEEDNAHKIAKASKSQKQDHPQPPTVAVPPVVTSVAAPVVAPVVTSIAAPVDVVVAKPDVVTHSPSSVPLPIRSTSITLVDQEEQTRLLQDKLKEMEEKLSQSKLENTRLATEIEMQKARHNKELEEETKKADAKIAEQKKEHERILDESATRQSLAIKTLQQAADEHRINLEKQLADANSEIVKQSNEYESVLQNIASKSNVSSNDQELRAKITELESTVTRLRGERERAKGENSDAKLQMAFMRLTIERSEAEIKSLHNRIEKYILAESYLATMKQHIVATSNAFSLANQNLQKALEEREKHQQQIQHKQNNHNGLVVDVDSLTEIAAAESPIPSRRNEPMPGLVHKKL